MTDAHAWDVIVVGSGAGGGTVAAALAPMAQAGRRILVLERGAALSVPAPMPEELASAAAWYDDGGATLTADGSVSLAIARVLGGATALSSGVLVVPTATAIDGWGVPGLDGADVEARATRLAAAARYLADDAVNENNRLFAEGAARAGFVAEALRVHLAGCRGAGVCHLGCPNGAVQGTHRVQLPAAAAAGVQVVTGVEVLELAPRRLRVRVAADATGAPWPPGEHALVAPCIVLAAGALGTVGLLLRAGFGRGRPALGRGVTVQPAHVVVAEHARPITNDVGHPTAFRVDATADGFTLEPCFSSPLVTARHVPGFGASHAQVLAAYPRLQMLRVTARDRATDGHRVTLDADGRAVLRYRLTGAVRGALVAGQRAAARVAFAAGAVRVHVPAAEPARLERREIDLLDRRIAAAHELPGRVSLSATQPLGGAAVSASTATGVTDAWGRVHGAPWLRIADGALCPDTPGAHPAATIMALADRVADAVRNEWSALAAAASAVA